MQLQKLVAVGASACLCIFTHTCTHIYLYLQPVGYRPQFRQVGVDLLSLLSPFVQFTASISEKAHNCGLLWVQELVRCTATGSCTDISARVRKVHKGRWALAGKQGKHSQAQPQAGKWGRCSRWGPRAGKWAMSQAQQVGVAKGGKASILWPLHMWTLPIVVLGWQELDSDRGSEDLL